MKAIDGTSNKSLAERRDSPPTATGYVVIDQEKRHPEQITQREVDSIDESTSESNESSSVCSEVAAASAPPAPAKVPTTLCQYTLSLWYKASYHYIIVRCTQMRVCMTLFPTNSMALHLYNYAATIVLVVQKLQCNSMADMPVAMSNATAVYHNGELVVGGAYTGRSTSDVLLHTYDSNFDIWSPLPPSPLKWSALSTLDNKVVLVGGKEAGKSKAGYTNKLAILDDSSKTWSFLNPPMQFARLSPVVLTYSGYLIVAGGGKGSLDYSAEIFDLNRRQWTLTAPLPHKCFKHTSTAIDGVWYLLNEDSGHIFYTDILAFVQSPLSNITSSERHSDSSEQSPMASSRSDMLNGESKISDGVSTVIWNSLESQPPCKPFRITSIEGNLLALSAAKSAVSAHAHVDGQWRCVGKLPLSTSTAAAISDPENSSGQLYLFGGDGGGGKYSSKLFKVSLVSKETKKATLRVGLDTATFITN